MIGVLAARLKSNLGRADHMISDLLDANRLKAGEAVPLKLGDHCLNDIAQNSLDELRQIHGDRFRLSSNETIRGRWCRSSLKRIIENLSSNAIKYGSDKSPISVQLQRVLTPFDDRVQITVRNEGNPIPREEQPGLFQPFHRTPTAQTGDQKGWGLGLALVKGLAQAHGGSVSLNYSDERGTEFCVDLPRVTRKKPT
jgi:signal transduction histidine kinase